MALILTLLGLCLAMVLAPETPAARFLHRALIALPARGLARISRGHIVYSLVLVALAAAALAFLDEELLVVLSLMAPEALAWFAMFEIGTLIETFVLVTAAATTLRLHQFTALARRIARPAARAPRRRRAADPVAANDDEDHWRDRTSAAFGARRAAL